MESNAHKHDRDENSVKSKDGVPEDVQTGRTIDIDDFCPSKVRKIKEDEWPSRGNTSGEVNMEADITADDIMHAGGIGARDDINSLLPISSDFTDVEEHIHDVEDYEELEDEVPLRHSQSQKDPGSENVDSEVEGDISASDAEVRRYEKHEGPSHKKSSEDVNVDSVIQETSENIVKDIASAEEENVVLSTEDTNETVYMEASVTSDDVMRAGGFGAKDDISSFLPVASDFTDFEASLRGARDYENADEKIDRPGLGWNSKAE